MKPGSGRLLRAMGIWPPGEARPLWVRGMCGSWRGGGTQPPTHSLLSRSTQPFVPGTKVYSEHLLNARPYVSLLPQELPGGRGGRQGSEPGRVGGVSVVRETCGRLFCPEHFPGLTDWLLALSSDRRGPGRLDRAGEGRVGRE